MSTCVLLASRQASSSESRGRVARHASKAHRCQMIWPTSSVAVRCVPAAPWCSIALILAMIARWMPSCIATHSPHVSARAVSPNTASMSTSARAGEAVRRRQQAILV
eukprot:CAMPEP_0115856290 /NCGR_PEP_ID=MMETSP0287-20121206/14975_1 /TAXON_ID=412157 /ORGANISM="Chrysochromulina rotalis, Strain UIO044" /LENGTH=106 /DNA_ID=CAMNT_0003310457 /DNA_START=909 /DNA_END=1226 /DNA_ORIENTATION=-